MDGLERDRQRLREYYRALLREAEKKKPRGGAQPDPEKIEAAKRAVELELRRKLAELDERYAIEATLRPLVLIRTERRCWPSTCRCSASGRRRRTRSIGTRC